MPNGLIIGLFVAIIGALAVIVWWELTRRRSAFGFASKSSKLYFQSEPVVSPLPIRKEVKRGFDAWDRT
jgi:hypothetical protein